MIPHPDLAARRSPSVASVDSTLVIEKMEREIPERPMTPPAYSDNEWRGRSRHMRQEYEEYQEYEDDYPSQAPCYSPHRRHSDRSPSDGARHRDWDSSVYYDPHHPDYLRFCLGADLYAADRRRDGKSRSTRASSRRR
jgi:hypothetical protein